MNHKFLPLLWLVFIGHQATYLSGSELKSDKPLSSSLLQTDSSGRTTIGKSSVTVRSNRNEKFSTQLRVNYPLAAGRALEFSAQVDPIKNEDGSTADIDAGITLGMLSPESNPDHIDAPANKVCIELKEFADRYRFTIILDGQTISFWGPPRIGPLYEHALSALTQLRCFESTT